MRQVIDPSRAADVAWTWWALSAVTHFDPAEAPAILDPPIPRLVNTDGEEMLFSRVHFGVTDVPRA